MRTSGTGGLCISVIAQETNYAARVMPVKIAIVGGGIGGLTAAIALARKGAEVEVLEQAEALPALGASIQIGPDAVRLLGELGLLPALREVGVLTPAVELRRWDDDTRLLRTELGPAMEAHFGAPQLDFFRPDLYRVLPTGRRCVSGHASSASTRTTTGSSLMEDGSVRRADAAIAADGINSPLRAQLTGVDDPIFSGTVVYRGIAPTEDVADLDLSGASALARSRPSWSLLLALSPPASRGDCGRAGRRMVA